MSARLSIFFSYSHDDSTIARSIAQALSEKGVRVWIDEGELRIGDSIIEKISHALEEVHFVVALISQSAVQSQWCKKELSLAMTGGLRRKGVKILPLRLGDVQMPPALLDSLYVQVDPENPTSIADRLISDAMKHQVEFETAAKSSQLVESSETFSTKASSSATPRRKRAGKISPELARRCEEVIEDARNGGYPPRSLERRNGIVKWFNEDKGYGFITDDSNADFFVHYSFIVVDGYRTLTEGQLVTFVVGYGKRGTAAVAILPD